MGQDLESKGTRAAGRLTPGLLFLLAMAFPGTSGAATINVPGDWPTIREAVDAAASGDTVLIAPGVHNGGVFVDGKSVRLASWFQTTGNSAYIEQTVLSGIMGDVCRGNIICRGDSVVEFGPDADGGSVVGLTITNGIKGVRSASFVDISYSRIIAVQDGVNYTSGSGGTLSNSLFADNSDDGIDMQSKVDMRILNNIIRDNHDDGIEFRLYAYSGPVLYTDIIGNQITGNGEDGLQLIDYPDASNRVIRIEKNLFGGNAMASVGCMADGNTIEDYSGAPITERISLINNTFRGNNYGMVGGANVIALNNIFQDTLASAMRRVVGNSIASYTLFWDNGLDYEDTVVDLPNILHVDPLLAADGSLSAGSPAINAGTAFFQWLGETVLDLPPSSYSGSAPDMGAFEFDLFSPTAGNDSASVSEGGIVSVPAPGVLSNDIDPDGDPLTVGPPVSGPTHGLLILNPDGSWQYTHDGSETSSDSFVYDASDPDGNSARATVSIAVLPVNDPPTAVNDNLLADLNSTGNVFDILWNDFDPDIGDSLGLVSVDMSGTLGTAVILGNTIEYTPPAGFTGDDTFGYTMRDLIGVTSTATVTVHVQDLNIIPIAVKVNAGSDDAEESAMGSVALTSTDLELIFDGSDQTVGIRFNQLAVPQGATITRAYIQFKVDEATSTPTSLAIRGEATDDAPTFLASSRNISSRTTTAAAVSWSPASWPTVGASGPDQQTPNISPVISQIVNRPGWAIGHSLAVIITGAGHRVAEAFEGDALGAPTLHLEYVSDSGPPVNQPPVVNAGPDQTITLPGGAILDGTVTDDGLPNPPGVTVLTWSQVSGPATGGFGNPGAADTTATFTQSGTYVLRLTGDDGQYASSDDVTIVVNDSSAGVFPVEVRVSGSADDAEEKPTGSVSLSSTDLELVFDGAIQTVGMRFNGVTVSQGQTIVRAWIQFTANEVQSEATSLSFQGEANDTSPVFTTTRYDISARAGTAATVPWSPVPWSTTGSAGPDQRTPDLAAVIQEIVNRPGWTIGNSLSIFVTGTGHRTATAYDSSAAAAPLLHIEVAVGSLDTAPGTVGDTLRVAPAGADQVELSWSASCGLGAIDYAIYEGAIGSWSSHTAVACHDTLGDLTETITPSPGDRYFLVVPLSAQNEGSYGTKSNGVERPQGTSVCLAAQSLASCP